MRKVKLFTLLTALICAVSMQAQGNLVAVPAPSSSYVPTQIVNGGFETEPTMAGSGENRIPNGTNQGWNTTETGTNCFEWIDNVKQYHNGNLNPIGNYCVEMNADNPATLYQDLYTYGGDVIRWSLAHAVRTKISGSSQQHMRVDVGAPLYNGDNIVYPTGVGNNINTNINSDTKATYRYNGITNPTGHDYGFNGQNLQNLRLSKSSQASQWYYATGVYIVPESQPVTRFAFVSENTDYPSFGNLLDDISFSTLIGDLSATYGDNNSVVIKGYWGETDTSKKLIIDINGTPNEVDMTSVSGQNFVITMTYDNTPSVITIYHEDYVSAARTISVNAYDVTANLANGAYWATFYSNAGNYQAPDGTQVFAVNLNTTTAEITMTEISDRIAKSGEGVVLKQETTSSEPTTTTTITMTKTETTPAGVFSANSLLGTMTSITNPGNAYVLNGKNGVGFYKLSSSGTIGANKAYLQTTSGAREFFLFGDATGIEIIDHSPLTIDHSVYDLQGRRVQNPTKGLYIVNGKKVFINK